MALSDKIIEVVDGHGITSKAKADVKMKGCPDPNVQIVFYAQPETIERYISEEMIDSGFLGRAIITLDDKNLVGNKPKMFISRGQHNKTIDPKLAKFYATRKIGEAIKNVYVAAPDEKGLEELTAWSEGFVYPILERNVSNNSAMYKMISRIGNTAEQLYAVILGICREWDIYLGNKPRTSADVSPSCMFPLLEFWTESKEFVVREYIMGQSDPIAIAIEDVLMRMITGKIKSERGYAEIVKERGIVPRSLLIRSMRNQSKLIKKLDLRSQEMFMTKVNQVLDTMIANDMIREEMLARPDRLLKSKKVKFVGFA